MYLKRLLLQSCQDQNFLLGSTVHISTFMLLSHTGLECVTTTVQEMADVDGSFNDVPIHHSI